jgi:hypothetical protein
MAKPQALGIDPKQIIVDSLMTCPKYPHEIEKYHEKKVEEKYRKEKNLISLNYINNKKEIQKKVNREVIKLRTIEKHLKELQTNGIVKQEKKFGRYFLTTQLLNDAAFGPKLFHNEAMSRLFCRKDTVVPNVGRDACPFMHIRFTKNDWREKCLFNFVNRIGVYITYVMLQAMNPNLNAKRQTLTFEQRDDLAKKWASNSIFGDFILWQFANLPELDNKEMEEPFLELKKKTFDEFSKALNNLYPYADGALSSSMLALPQKINALRQSVEFKSKTEQPRREKKINKNK